MLRLAADENFNNDIVRGILRRNPAVDIVRIQDVGLSLEFGGIGYLSVPIRRNHETTRQNRANYGCCTRHG
jgi:hypothetical protein